MRRRLIGSVSGIVTAVTIAATALAAVNFRGPTADDLMRDIAVVERELTLAQHNLETYRDKPPIAEQIELRIAVLQTTHAMLEQKRLSWLRGLKLIYRVDGWKVQPDPNALAALQDQLDDAETGMVTARKWAATSENEMSKNMALALEQVHMLTHAAIRQQMALEGLGIALPQQAAESVSEVSSRDDEVVGSLKQPASVR